MKWIKILIGIVAAILLAQFILSKILVDEKDPLGLEETGSEISSVEDQSRKHFERLSHIETLRSTANDPEILISYLDSIGRLSTDYKSTYLFEAGVEFFYLGDTTAAKNRFNEAIRLEGGMHLRAREFRAHIFMEENNCDSAILDAKYIYDMSNQYEETYHVIDSLCQQKGMTTQ